MERIARLAGETPRSGRVQNTPFSPQRKLASQADARACSWWPDTTCWCGGWAPPRRPGHSSGIAGVLKRLTPRLPQSVGQQAHHSRLLGMKRILNGRGNAIDTITND